MSAKWYALHSKPMKEAVLSAQLLLRGIENYFPFVRFRSVKPRARKVKPYFPGYIFARIDLEQQKKNQLWLPGLAGVVSFDGIPCYVPNNLIEAIRRRADDINAAGGGFLETLKPRDPVRIQTGPFKGYEAILDTRPSGEARVRILLTFLNRPHIPLELPEQQILPLKR